MIHFEVIGLGLSGLSANDADSVGVGVSHINDALGVHKNAMQPIHTATQRRFAFGAIAFFAVAG